MIVPAVHLNGTSREELLSQYEASACSVPCTRLSPENVRVRVPSAPPSWVGSTSGSAPAS